MLPKNEIYYEDMIDILESYKQYVPSQEVVLENPPPIPMMAQMNVMSQ